MRSPELLPPASSPTPGRAVSRSPFPTRGRRRTGWRQKETHHVCPVGSISHVVAEDGSCWGSIVSNISPHISFAWLADLVDGRLGADEQAETKMHLAGCPQCAAN